MFVGAIKKFLNRNTHNVFGTFNVIYDPTEFERERDDGVTMIGLAPECRVFIYGAEVTQDVESVSVSNSLDGGNTCKINLQNPRGRYEISKNDLMKKWREDKDILATYTYDYFNTIDPLKWDSVVDKLAGGIYGEAGVAQAKELINMGRQAVSLGSSLFSGTPPKVRGVTRMVFETKFFSGFDKRVGDFVFDYRDPVQVFFKGRFSPYWYFGFSGIITKHTSSFVQNQHQTVSIHAGDPLSIWKRSIFLNKASFFNMANLENRIKQNSASTAKQLTGTNYLTMVEYVKFLAYAPDFYSKVTNCHRSNYPADKQKNETVMDAIYRDMRNGALIDENFMNTSQAQQIKAQQENSDSVLSTVKNATTGAAKQFWTRFTGENSYLIDCENINYCGFTGGPNKYSFSPINDLYLQLNEMKIDELKGELLEKYFNASVRFWEAKHEIETPSPTKGTGWKDVKAFGVSGIHPALKTSFLDNFNILENIWEQCYYNQKYVDSLLLSPMDKIRETVIGSVTEKRSVANSEDNMGANLNLFRPRLFIVAPERYSGNRKLETDFRKLGEILNSTSSSIYDTLSKQLKSAEYNLFSSAMGDIFIEPMMYDTHPLEHSGPIEPRNIVVSSQDVKFRDESSLDPSAYVTRKDTAYFFNTSANHPFFLMDKDLISLDQTFSPEMVHTSVSVIGAQTQEGGVFNVIGDDLLTNIAFLRMQNEKYHEGGDKTKIDNTAIGVYIADGLEKYLKYVGNEELLNDLMEDAHKYRSQLEKLILLHLFQSDFSTTLKAIAKKFIDNVDWLYKNVPVSEKWYPELRAEWDSIKEYRESEDVEGLNVDNYIIDYILDKYTNDLKIIYKENNLLREDIDIDINTFFNTNASNDKFEDDPSSLIQAINEAEAGYGESGYGESSGETVKVNSTAYYDLLGKLFNYFENIKSSSERIIEDLIFLYTPTAVKDNANVLNKFKKVYDIYGDMFIAHNKITEDSNITSLDKLKYLETLGLYNPRKDIVKKYGYNPLKQPIKNIYVNNGAEAKEYAVSVFNRLYGKAYSIHAVQIGRPEYFLNRPVYCEFKDSIGLLDTFTIEYKYGGSFTSSVNLNYIRKNAILFDYSIENLDELVGEHDNEFFKKEADKFYLTAKLLSGGKDMLNQAGGLIKGTPLQEALINQVTSEAGEAADNFLKFGGLYSSHDKHGHLNYDEEPVSSDIISTDVRDAETKKENVGLDNLTQIYTLSISIEYNLNREIYLLEQQNELLQQSDTANKKLHNLQQDIESSKKELQSANSRTSNILTTLIENKQKQIKNTEVELNSIEYNYNITKDQLNEVYKELFRGKYVNKRTAPSGKPNDLTNYCKTQYKLYKDAAESKKEVTLGLFTELLRVYIILYKYDIEHIQVVYDGKDRELEGLGVIKNYINYIPPQETESSQASTEEA